MQTHSLMNLSYVYDFFIQSKWLNLADMETQELKPTPARPKRQYRMVSSYFSLFSFYLNPW